MSEDMKHEKTLILMFHVFMFQSLLPTTEVATTSEVAPTAASEV